MKVSAETFVGVGHILYYRMNIYSALTVRLRGLLQPLDLVQITSLPLIYEHVGNTGLTYGRIDQLSTHIWSVVFRRSEQRIHGLAEVTSERFHVL